MGLDGTDLLDEGDRFGDGGGGGEEEVSEAVSCSICLDAVTDDGDRSRAKLQCGHEFHLDCIGSAFNIKGAMQCPNCRKTEKGQWLYATGFGSLLEYSIDDSIIDEDLYDPSYSEMSSGVHWCPFSGLARFPSFSGLARFPSLFDEGEISSTTYHELLGQHASFAEHAATSTTAHSNPYIAYFGTVHPSSSTSSATVSDVSNFNGHWNGAPHPNEIPASYAFPGVDVHMNTWDHHSHVFPTSSSHIVGAEQTSVPSVSQRARPGSFMQPFVVGHGAAARSVSSVATSMVPPYPGSVARAHDRVQALQAYFQQSSNSPSARAPVVSGTRRSNSQNRSMAQVGAVAPPSDQANGFYFFPSSTSGRSFQEPDNHWSNRFPHSREGEHFPSYPSSQLNRETGWSPFYQPGAGSEAGMRFHNLRQRHGTEWRQSQNR